MEEDKDKIIKDLLDQLSEHTDHLMCITQTNNYSTTRADGDLVVIMADIVQGMNDNEKVKFLFLHAVAWYLSKEEEDLEHFNKTLKSAIEFTSDNDFGFMVDNNAEA